MKRLFLNSVLSVLVILVSCTKENTPARADESLPAGSVLANGVFVSNVHPTSGTVKIVQDTSGKKYLVFENFRTDNGPDLRVWLSPSISASPYQEVGILKAVSGNFSYQLNSSINYTSNNRILIWCEDFSILFGHAVLQ